MASSKRQHRRARDRQQQERASRQRRLNNYGPLYVPKKNSDSQRTRHVYRYTDYTNATSTNHMPDNAAPYKQRAFYSPPADYETYHNDYNKSTNQSHVSNRIAPYTKYSYPRTVCYPPPDLTSQDSPPETQQYVTRYWTSNNTYVTNYHHRPSSPPHFSTTSVRHEHPRLRNYDFIVDFWPRNRAPDIAEGFKHSRSSLLPGCYPAGASHVGLDGIRSKGGYLPGDDVRRERAVRMRGWDGGGAESCDDEEEGEEEDDEESGQHGEEDDNDDDDDDLQPISEILPSPSTKSNTQKDIQPNPSKHTMSQSDSIDICKPEQEQHSIQPKHTTKHSIPLRWRHTWPCQFCGPECFCENL